MHSCGSFQAYAVSHQFLFLLPKLNCLHSSLIILTLSKNCQTSAIADHITSTGHNVKWDHFEILATGRSVIQCRIKESLLFKDLKAFFK